MNMPRRVGRNRGFVQFIFAICVLICVSATTVYYSYTILKTNQTPSGIVELKDLSLKESNKQQGPLPVYWINSDASKDRRRRMEGMFKHISNAGTGVSPTRVAAINVKEVHKLAGEMRLNVLKNAIFLDRDEKTRHSKQYTVQKAAATLSHLTAILQAYNDGHESVMVLEDDVELNRDFILSWRSYADRAPRNWNILQWHTTNDLIANQNVSDSWTSWQPDHHSAGAYMVNREGLRQILENSHFFDGHYRSIRHLTEEGVVASDEVVFYYAGPSYTSCYPWIRRTDYSVQNHTKETAELGTIEFSESPIHTTALRTERIVVVMNIAIKRSVQFPGELKALREDIDALAIWNPDCKWHVNVVVSEESMIREFEMMARDLPPFVEIHVRASKRFNKYLFLSSLLSNGTISGYDYILLKDSDIRLAGFAWNTFMDRKGDAVVAGALRENVVESLAHNAGKRPRQCYQIHEAPFWKEGLGPTFWKGVIPLDVPIIEQFFALFQADFGQWYFSQILTNDFVSQQSDWGPDLMWCGAARQYKPDQTPCRLVPVSLLHVDTKTTKVNMTEGFDELDRVRGIKAFKPWLSYQHEWGDIVRDANFIQVKKRCNAHTHSKYFNITDCAVAAMVPTSDKYGTVPVRRGKN